MASAGETLRDLRRRPAAWDGLGRANALALADRVRLLARLPVDLDPALFTALPKVGCAFPP